MSTLVPIEVLRALGANRWALPVIALLSREGGARSAVIARAYGLSAHSLTRCLEHLRGCGWVIPNPGHGHPLRPEYVLSEAGRPVGALCERIGDAQGRVAMTFRDFSRWSLPLVAGLAPRMEPLWRVAGTAGPGHAARAVAETLQGMIGQDLVTRRLEDRFPPLALYGLSGRGRGR